MDRLTEAKYFDLTTTGTGTSRTTAFSTDYKFNEKLTYDLRGNITTLQRNGFKLAGFTSNNYAAADYGAIDNLVYTYTSQNQVTKITDNTTSEYLTKGFKYANTGATADYDYDDNGNLIRDANKGITNIEYNYLNLPQVITFTNNRNIKFVYDAGGSKLQKITNDNGTVTTYDYVNGVEYKNTILQRFAHTEGSVTRNEFGRFDHEYVLRDHLGNTRVTFKDAVDKGAPMYFDANWNYIDPNVGDGVVTKDDIKQINHYYCFGLNMEGNWNGSSPDAKNKYQYNGKELQTDFDLTWEDYGARMYDPAVGRWWSIDPEGETDEQINYTGYHYTFNNPVRFTDPDGREPEDIGGGDPPTIGERILKGIFSFFAESGSAASGRANNDENFKKNVPDGIEHLINNFLFLQATYEMSEPGGSSNNSAVKEETTVVKEVKATENVVNLELRAKEIQNVQKSTKARNLSTTAVAEVTNPDGTKTHLVASSRNTLTPAQRNALQKGEQAVRGKGHAERTIINHTQKNKQTINKIAASRGVCQQCEEAIKGTGAKIVSPLKKVRVKKVKHN